MTDITTHTGFTPPADTATAGRRGTAAIAALMMIVALTLGTLAAATAVGIGLVRGDGLGKHGRAYAIELAQPFQHRG